MRREAKTAKNFNPQRSKLEQLGDNKHAVRSKSVERDRKQELKEVFYEAPAEDENVKEEEAAKSDPIVNEVLQNLMKAHP